MTEKFDGGFAFPQYARVGEAEQAVGGITLQDYFAGQALIGLMPQIGEGIVENQDDPNKTRLLMQNMTALAYMVGGFMVLERERK
jgi:hypothetical protein